MGMEQEQAVGRVTVATLPQGQTAEVYEKREDWLEARRPGIGSSDAAAVLGVSRFGSPLSLYHEKLGTFQDTRDKGETEFQRWGQILEEPIAQRFQEEVGRTVVSPAALVSELAPGRHVVVRDTEDPRLVASPDRVQLSGPHPSMGLLEIKNASVYVAEEWDRETGEIPLEYMVQVQHQLMVTGLQWASIAALIGGNLFVYADIQRDDDFIVLLRQRELEFLWHLDNAIPPPADGSKATTQVLRALYPRDTGEIINLQPEALDLTATILEAKREIKAWEAKKDAAENQLRALIGDATVGTLPDGSSWTYKHQTRAEHVVRASEFRVLRYRGAK
jgi:putative phage-type endonuclease